MRSLDALFLGLFSVAAVMPLGCSGPDAATSSGKPSSASGSGTGGAAGGGGAGGSGVPIDGYKECTEYCVKTAERCSSVSVDNCIKANCEDWKRDVGPECQDEFGVYYACVRAWKESLSPGDPDACLQSSGECHPARLALTDCQNKYGCVPADTCWEEPAPNGTTGCYCRGMCQQRELHSLCWMEGTKQICDCVIDGVSVGMCDQQPELVCWDAIFYDPCCVPFFMIP